MSSSSPLSVVQPVYERWPGPGAVWRKRLGRPITYAEKVLVNQLSDPWAQELERQSSYADFFPDRVALQDALAQIVALQFVAAGLDEGSVPTTVHCDHLIQAKLSEAADLRS